MFNFIQIDLSVIINKSTIIKVILGSLILNLMFLGPIAYYFSNSFGETVLIL
mgnify:FL=1